MYKFTITDKHRNHVLVLTYTTVDMAAAELQLNILRDTYGLPEFIELQDGSFITENKRYQILLEEIIVESNIQNKNERTYF